MSVFFVRNTIPLYNGFHVYAKLFERLSFVNMLSLFSPYGALLIQNGTFSIHLFLKICLSVSMETSIRKSGNIRNFKVTTTREYRAFCQCHQKSTATAVTAIYVEFFYHDLPWNPGLPTIFCFLLECKDRSNDFLWLILSYILPFLYSAPTRLV